MIKLPQYNIYSGDRPLQRMLFLCCKLEAFIEGEKKRHTKINGNWHLPFVCTYNINAAVWPDLHGRHERRRHWYWHTSSTKSMSSLERGRRPCNWVSDATVIWEWAIRWRWAGWRSSKLIHRRGRRRVKWPWGLLCILTILIGINCRRRWRRLKNSCSRLLRQTGHRPGLLADNLVPDNGFGLPFIVRVLWFPTTTHYRSRT